MTARQLLDAASSRLTMALACLTLVAVVYRPSAAQVEIRDVRVGIGGHYRVGHWTLVRVDVRSPRAMEGGRLELQVPDGEGVPSITVVPDLRIRASDTNSFEAFTRFGRVNGDLKIRLRNADGAVIAAKDLSAEDVPDAVLSSQHLVLTLGSDIGVGEAISSRREKADQATVQALLADPSRLPSRWFGYGGVSLIVLSASHEFVAGLSESQLAALDLWVRMGGRLLVSGGGDAAANFASEGPLARFIPGTFDRVQLQRQTSGLEGYAGNTAKSLTSFVAEGELTFRLPMAMLKDVRGKVELSEGIGQERVPTIIRASHGFGHVMFIAVDLDRPPLSQWADGRRRVLARLVEMSLEETLRDDSDLQFAKLTQIGFEDLTGQLRGSLEQFQNVLLVPFSWIAILVGIYILLVGPLDYFLLRAWKQRFGVTWLTFPLTVLAGCLLAYLLTQHWKGQTLRVNQIDVVDIDAQSGLTRAQTWSHLFSPTSRKYDVAVEPSDVALELKSPRGRLTSWQGLPGKSFGGMNTSRLNDSAEPYQIICDVSSDSEQTVKVEDIPVDIFGTRSFHGLMWGYVDLPPSEVLMADADNQLSGKIRNPLPVNLRDCRLCYGRWVYPLPSLAAGGMVEIDRFSRVRTIDGMLTRTRVDQDDKDRSQPWDRKSLDLSRIMEMMMFHKAAGGTEYTSLLHRFQGEMDFTDHLMQGPALLVGKTDEAASSILDSEQAACTTSTYYRVLLPVTGRR